MDHKALIAMVAASVGIFLLLLIFFVTRSYFRHRSKTPPPVPRATSLQNGISKLHQQQQNMFNSNKRRANFYVLRKGLFNWSDNPSLVTDAVENGWSRFAFTNTNNIDTVEIGYEVCEGSADFIQKIRFNSGLKKPVAVIKSALPLPGPALNTTPFPQVAYFEITIMSDGVNNVTARVNREGEKIKLIRENNKEKSSSESLVHVTSGNNTRGVFGNMEELTVGLAGGGWMPVKIPGSYPGSIGFKSDGSVYLEGVQLTNELEFDEWGRVEKVIGCGYSPCQKKVYFTVDGKLVREVHCTTEEFKTPLYPILAANGSVTVVVNFGQSVFKYTQANLHRTPNPCFIGQSASSPIIGFEDSRELFSMGRIDAHWLDQSTKRSEQYFGSINREMSDYDESSDGDLFEIVLDNNNSRGRSPSVHY
ncbi:uncharacterized protein LOC143608503 [Bidens hawaiensis]|uniref:uncharacterized protein LOC143608503 n=1 Tax=Bidens hawaiensis TaxID=980011 RepID=UPI00404B4F03